MDFILFGTAAAEGLPNPFCNCRICAQARLRGGRDIRSRSGALLDGVVKIDFGPDTIAQAQRTGCDLAHLTTLVFTHQHHDHISPMDLYYHGGIFITDTQLPMLHIYGNEEVVSILEEYLPSADGRAKSLRLTVEEPLKPFQEVAVQDGTTILPLPADHAPGSLVLRIGRGGKQIFFGHDSGRYPDETVSALADVPLDLALFDCTMGLQQSDNRGHMDADGVLESIDRLRAVGAVTSKTTLAVTHFSHNCQALHDELRGRFEPHGVTVAYDGIRWDI